MALASAPARPAYGQPCEPYWHEGFGSPGLNGAAHTLVAFDDGGGAALYAGGDFTTADGITVNRVARWDGDRWSPLGAGIGDGAVFSLAVFDDGSGAALYAAGNFTAAGGVAVNSIAKWDGRTWSPLGTGVDGAVRALAVFDDGGGPALYAGGEFTAVGGAAANYIAKWDGNEWSPLGSGTDAPVRALLVFDDGGGPALHAGGSFSTAGGLSANCIAKWDGNTWGPVGIGIWGTVHAMAVFDDGGGPALYVGGSLSTADGAVSNIARLGGAGWSPLGAGTNGTVRALAVFDDGAGPALYAGGDITTAGGVAANRIAKWNGVAWSPLDEGINGAIDALAVFDDGSGAALYAGGLFSIAGDVAARRIARWNGGGWSRVGRANGTFGGRYPHVDVLTVFDDGGGPALYAAGDFNIVGSAPARHIACWNGDTWSPLGSGIDGGSQQSQYVIALTAFDDGSGPALYAGGVFDTAGGAVADAIARWDGGAWSPLGNGLSGGVDALAVFDDGSGPALYAGGDLRINTGRKVPENVVRWDGASWSVVGGGVDGWVHALAVFDDGSGAALYVAGDFSEAGGTTARKIAKWDGSRWSALSSTVTGGNIYALTVFDDGSGPALYAGGSFLMAGEVEAKKIARWDGKSWSPLGAGMSGTGVFALTAFDDGTGPALYAGGAFQMAGGGPAKYVAKWDGSAWSPLDGGPNQQVNALAAFDDGSGPALYAGGWFTAADGVPSSYIAKWGGCACAGDVDVDGDIDVDDLTTLLSSFGTPSAATRRTGDLDGDGDVDLSDLTVLLAYFGTTC